ncbi:hypothetical protein [uncultured Chryseobacterium sp.]
MISKNLGLLNENGYLKLNQ